MRDIELYSTCEHHLVPFHGVAHVGYIPARTAVSPGCPSSPDSSTFRAAPAGQERLTTQIADALVEQLDVQGVIVVVEAEHLCMSMRGVRKPGPRPSPRLSAASCATPPPERRRWR